MFRHIDEYMVACYGTTEYPEDMTSVVLKCEGADEKTIHYAYKCRSEVLAGATAVSAVVPPIDTKVSLTASSTDAEGYIEEGYAFSLDTIQQPFTQYRRHYHQERKLSQLCFIVTQQQSGCNRGTGT